MFTLYKKLEDTHLRKSKGPILKRWVSFIQRWVSFIQRCLKCRTHPCRQRGQTGSLEPFQQHQSVIRKALEYFESQLNPATGLLNYDHRFWLFLDWTNLHKEGCSTEISQRGYGNEILADIQKRWAPMVEHGTTWENFPIKTQFQ